MRKYMYDFSATTKHGDADPVYICGGCLATMLDKKPLQESITIAMTTSHAICVERSRAQ